jgi:hypothetical protein
MRCSRRALAVTLLGVSLVACQEKAKEDGGSGATALPAGMRADAFCEQIMAAPLRAMQAKCAPADAGSARPDTSPGAPDRALRDSRGNLEVNACTQMLAPRVEARRLSLPAATASACAAAIGADSWKESLEVRGVAWYLAHEKACQGAMVGNQAQGAPCELHLECKTGLSCHMEPGADQGSCAEGPGDHAPCSRPRYPALAAEARGACATGFYCNVETATERVYAQASFKPGAGTVSPTLVGDFLDPAARDSALSQRRAAALKDATDFGMIGLLNQGKGTEGRGEGIGLGEIGTIGRGAGTGTGEGFGSGHGRLGRSNKPPQVRMGAVTVNGRLPPEVVQRVVRQNFGRFRLCYENGLRGNPALAGNVIVRFVIGRDGHVSNAAASGDLPDKGVSDCILRSFYGLSFPEPEGGIVTVSYPVHLSPGDTSKSPAGTGEAAKGAPTRDAGAEPDAATSDAGASEGDSADGGASTLERGSREPKDVCLPLGGEGGSCWESWQCAEGLRCLNGQCSKAGFVPAGGACQDQTDCEAGHYCEGTCKPSKKAGDACQASVECQGACAPGDMWSPAACVAVCGTE